MYSSIAKGVEIKITLHRCINTGDEIGSTEFVSNISLYFCVDDGRTAAILIFNAFCLLDLLSTIYIASSK